MAVMVLKDAGGGGGEQPELEVNWNTGTGSTAAVVMDEDGANPFTVSACEHTDVMAVVTGSTHGWGATPNVLEIRCQGETRCWQVEQVITGISTNSSWYHRVFFFMPTNITSHHDLNHPNVHGYSDGIATFLGISDVTATEYRIHIQYGDFVSGDLRYFRQYASPRLTQGTWYRLETHIEAMGVHPYDSGLRAFRIHPRIYSVTNASTGDLSGSLLYDEGDYIHRDLDQPTNTMTLLHSAAGADGWPDDPHNGDEYWGVYHPTSFNHVAELRSIGVGAEGPGGSGTHLGSGALLVLAALRAQQSETGGGVWVGDDIFDPNG